MERIALVALGPGPDPSARSAVELLFTLQAERWAPEGAELCFVFAPYRWWEGPRQAMLALEQLQPSAALLLACDPDAEDVRVAAYACNVAAPEPDAVGQVWPGRSLYPGADAALPVTLDPQRLLEALHAVGAPAQLSRNAGLSVANRCLFALLMQGAAPVGCLRLPLTRETARTWGRPSPSAVNRACLLEAGQAAIAVAAAAAATPPGASAPSQSSAA